VQTEIERIEAMQLVLECAVRWCRRAQHATVCAVILSAVTSRYATLPSQRHTSLHIAFHPSFWLPICMGRLKKQDWN